MYKLFDRRKKKVYKILSNNTYHKLLDRFSFGCIFLGTLPFYGLFAFGYKDPNLALMLFSLFFFTLGFVVKKKLLEYDAKKCFKEMVINFIISIISLTLVYYSIK